MHKCRNVSVLTRDLAGVVEGDILATAVFQLLLLLQQSHAHEVEHLQEHTLHRENAAKPPSHRKY